MILILFQTLVMLVHSFNCASFKRRSPVFDGILHLGDCNRKPVEYCNSLVENSMCNPQKNECFCKHGFVAIQEEEKVVCRTLLTELYCRVDSDCVHVDGSVCHPGAGKCVCPSGKIYVPQLHGCRQRFEMKTDKSCEKCLLKQGTCFLYDLKDQPVNSKHASNVDQLLAVGCVCPQSAIKHGSENLTLLVPTDGGLCGSQLVDIGEECDPVNHTCKAQMAMCLPARRDHRLAHFSGRCSCPEITVAVYQPNLGYHECFTKIPKPQLSAGHNQDIVNPECAGCHAVEGVCYDMNDDGIGDGCRCPVDRAHSSTVDSDSQPYESPTKHHQQSSLSSPCTRKQATPPEDTGRGLIAMIVLFVAKSVLTTIGFMVLELVQVVRQRRDHPLCWPLLKGYLQPTIRPTHLLLWGVNNRELTRPTGQIAVLHNETQLMGLLKRLQHLTTGFILLEDLQIVFSSCTEESLTVCYVPHNDDQQINLSNQLQANQCSVHLVANTDLEPQLPDKTCQLVVRNGDPVQLQQWNLLDRLVARYCIQMNFSRQKSNSCGLDVIRRGKCSNNADNQVVTFAGQLYIHAERSNCRRPVERHIPFTCFAEVPCQKPEFLRAVTMKSDQPRLQLRVLNKQNLIIDSLLVGDLIRLEVVSVDYKYPVYPIAIDYCTAVSYHNRRRRLSENHIHRFIRKVIWESRCKKNGLLTPFLPDVKWVEMDPTIWSPQGLSATPHRSRPLTAFRVIPGEARVTITCAVRYCLLQDCIPIQNVSTFCSQAMSEFYDQQFHLLATMLRVEKPVQPTVSCRLISCITVSQLLLGCMVLLFLDLIVFFLLVWSYRHKLIWRLRPTPKSELQPSGDSRIIPEMSMSSTPQNDLFDSCLIGQPLIGVSGHRSTEGTDMESVRSHLNVCEFYPNSPALTPQSLVVGRAVISL